MQRLMLNENEWVDFKPNNDGKKVSMNYTNSKAGFNGYSLGSVYPSEIETVSKDVRIKFDLSLDTVEFINSVLNCYKSRKTLKDKFCIEGLDFDQYLLLLKHYREFCL